MKDIYWKKLTTFEKIIFVLGWFSVGNLIFWISFIITYIIGKDRKGKEFQQVFNPHTFKVPYVFGWITLIVVALCVIIIVLAALFMGTLLFFHEFNFWVKMFL